MKFSKEFKEAVGHLPEAEKTKLLLRLLKKDLTLANRLEFELLSNQSVEERRAKMKEKISREVTRMTKTFYSPGYLNMNIRYASGSITEYVKITKDKFGEASLNLHLMIEVLEGNNHNLAEFSGAKNRKLLVALLARCFKVLVLIHKLHDDFFLDLKDDLKQLGSLMSNNHYMMDNAIYHGFDVNWLLKGEIPDDIQEIQKDLRAKGYLK